MLHRRDAMLRLGTVGLAGGLAGGLAPGPDSLGLSTLLAAERRRPRADASAKSCILVYLWGGPPQQDMWDLKPEAPSGIRSLFEPISTRVPGIQFSDQLPLMAGQSDKMAVIRSYTHPSNRHEVGVYHTLTGKIDNTLAVPRNQRNRRDFPNPGGIVSYFSPPAALPASVTIPRPIGHDGVVYTGTWAGFLGPRYDPMELQPPAEVKVEAPHSLKMPEGVDLGRMQARYGLLKTLELQDRALQKSQSGLDGFREQALRMLTSADATSAFDVKRESDGMRDRYGRNEWGEAFLLSRRLIEAGVRLVTLVWYYVCPNGNVANVWDNHGGTGSLGGISGYDMLKQVYCLPSLDRGYSALLSDLDDRGLLDETLVAMMGEFGRTPKINKNSGRDHWGACQSVVLAGGGIRGGQVYGASDKIAAYPTKHPVSPSDFLATIYHALGLTSEHVIHDPQNRPHHLSEGRPLMSLFG